MFSCIFFSLVLFQVALGAMSVNDVSYLGWDRNAVNYAGYVDVAQGKNSLFYWFFESRHNPQEDPIILWFNGGPGCSSVKGLAFINGPGIIQPDLSHINNPYSWNTNASIIYLEQPAGTGLSESYANVTNDHESAQQTYEFLHAFFNQFTQFQKNPLHVCGFSDAGHSAAAVGAEILNHGDRNFNFHSISAFGGLLDAKIQYSTVHEDLCGGSGIPAVLNVSACAVLQTKIEPCLNNIQLCRDGGPSKDCSTTLEQCMADLFFEYQGNLFNLAQPCGNMSECYPQDEYYTKYLNLPEIQKALYVPKTEIQACNHTIFEYFAESGAQVRSSLGDWAKLLNNKIPVLLVAGQYDGAYSPAGIQKVARSIPWINQINFANSPITAWIRNLVHVGNVQHLDPLTYVEVLGAGHLITWDQPETAFTVINNWLAGNRQII